MKVLITGKNGQVGFALQQQLVGEAGIVAVDRSELDLSNPNAIRAKVREVDPAFIVNSAAYTAVDKAESEPDIAMAVNGIAPGVLAEEAKKRGIPLIHYSTDYVYPGNKQTPWVETDQTGPLSVYGKTKLAGDMAVQAVGGDYIILRTSWVYGNRGKNFYLTIKRLLAERDELSIVDDQFGAPTWCRTIADVTAQVMVRCCKGMDGLSGVYHLASLGQTSWCGFAAEITRQLGVENKIIKPITTDMYPLPAKRPAYSVLSCEKLIRTFDIKLPTWQDALAQCTQEVC